MTTVKDLVPGDPEQIWRLAHSYTRRARLCEEVGRGLRSLDVGHWYGPTAEAFHARFERQPRRFVSMADSYLQAAVALDTYAAVLAWAERQAGEVIAWENRADPTPEPVGAALTVTEQAELTGVIAENTHPEPTPPTRDQRALALGTYQRALDMLATVGDESAATITAAAELMPAPPPSPPTVAPAAPAPPPPGGLVVHAVLPAPRGWFDPSSLRDDPRDWAVAIKEIRRRLRWDGLDQLSPRLAQHIFEGHYGPTNKVNTGYHHRGGGVDTGALRVVKVIEGPDEHGVYSALVRGTRTPSSMVKKRTFFPDSWSREEVLYAVRHAFLDAMRSRETNYDPARRRFRGVYKDVTIEGYVKSGAAEPRLCDIVTAYPRGVRRRRKR